MSQLFSFHRFSLLLKLHLSEHLKPYLLGAGVLMGIWLVMLLPAAIKVSTFSESIYRNHGTMFTFIFCGAGAWFASELFRVVSTPVRGIPYLTLPASQVEKFLVAFLMLVLFVPVFIGVFYCIEGICFSMINQRLPTGSPRYELLDLCSDYINMEFRYFCFITPSFFLVGSIYFAKLPFVKTAVLAFVLFFITQIFLNDLIIRLLFPERPHYGFDLFQAIHFVENRRSYTVRLAGSAQLLVNTILLLILPALWYIAYVRFKEKEL
ncbi:hypothetical protein ACO2Q8_07695 [Larkinella sp. VNQ87]|uniref:hypothetical protein n=1 Tax=Larkinella sp. VNQ87 TaxID=3400921 RepID=UPI003C10FADA